MRPSYLKTTIHNCNLWLFILIILFASFISPIPLYADSDTSEANADSTEQTVYPERMKNRAAWEWILSFPGILINMPFAATFKVTEKIVSTVYQPRMVGWVYDITTSDDSTRAIRPAYGTRSGLGAKIYQKKLFNDESLIELSAKAGLNYRQKYQLKFEDFRIFTDDMYTDFYLGYRLYHNQEFYGIGPDAKKSDQTNHAHEFWWIDWDLKYSLFKVFQAKSSLHFTHNNILQRRDHDAPATIEVYDPQTLPGLEEGVEIFGYHASLIYDSRNSPGGPTRGQQMEFGGGIYTQVDSDRYKFWKLETDLQQYIQLFDGRVIRLRLAGSTTEPLSDKQIPFYYLSELGSVETLRGFERGRFWDKDMVLGSIEYRWPVWRRFETTIDVFLYYDVGQVANNIFKDIDPDKFQHGYGVGVRIWDDYSESLNLIFMNSKERFRIYLGYN